ncbi:substrate-binding domain-containing protein [Christensenellaceae bacterium OttesenSCG-928-M15]|nr:substrate-binding domain-containing protein [Christensenellaceae bacterium OttesenSCG-928-M15]
MVRMTKWISIGVAAVLLAMFSQLILSRSINGLEAAPPGSQYHMQIIGSDTDTFFYSQFTAGAKAAAADNNVFVEFVPVDRWDQGALYDNIRNAIYAGVDSVAFQSNDQNMTYELYEIASAHGVELMLYESENYQQASILAAGSNSYMIGTEAGELALRAAGESPCRAAVIVDRTEDGVTSTYHNMKIQGILEAFAAHPDAEIVETYSLSGSMLAGEYLSNVVLADAKNFNIIICLHEKTTSLLAQRLIDNNLLGSVQLVGYGALPQTLEYIERGVVFGTVCPDAYEVGYNTVALMYAKLNREQVNEYSSTRLFTITMETVREFAQDWQNGGGQ